MTRITSATVKTWARDMGANVVGIASVYRFKGAPKGHGPKDFVPQARSVVVAGVRLPDSIVDYDKYHLMFQEAPQGIAAAASVENLYMLLGHYIPDLMLNSLALRMANKLEIEGGYRSMPTPNTVHTGLGRPVHGLFLEFFSQRHAATRAGLGEFGFNNIVLTPEFGPRVRFVSVITEADLEPDPLLTRKICLREKCGGTNGPICLRRCTGGALQLRDNLDHDSVFIDTPSKTERSLCLKAADGAVTHQCVFFGTCMRVCPIRLRLKKTRAAHR